MAESRRDTLKIIGAIGATCAFPFSADELYGQTAHEHAHESKPPAPAGPYTPQFFEAAEYALISRLSDLIIPRTDTPGAVDAGVPQYIDSVVAQSADLQKRFRAGLASFDAGFLKLTEEQQVAKLTPLSEKNDAFFVLVKNLTADGYYTSYAGLVQELGYQGNVALASFPGCTHEH